MKRIVPTTNFFGHEPDGTAWIVDDVNCGEVLMLQGGVTVEDVEYPHYDARNGDTYKRILIERPGGFGDLIFLNPVIKQIRKRSPSAKIHVSVAPMFQDAVKHHPDIDKVIGYPIREKDFRTYDGVLWLENLIELSSHGREMHVVDLFLAFAGIQPEEVDPEEKQNLLYVPKSAKKAAKRFRKTERPRVGLQIKASAVCRTPKGWGAVIDEFTKKGWEVFLFGAPGEMKTPDNAPDTLTNLTQLDKPLTFLESAAVMTTCDVVVAPDSGLLHVAGAMGVPAVGVFAAFPGKIRCGYSVKTSVLQASGGCAPCFWHGRNGWFPNVGACVQSRQCDPLQSVKPAYIVEKAIEWSAKHALT